MSVGLNSVIYLNGAENFTSGLVPNQNHLSTKILSTCGTSAPDLDCSFTARAPHL